MKAFSFEATNKNGPLAALVQACAQLAVLSVPKYCDLDKEQASPALVVE